MNNLKIKLFKNVIDKKTQEKLKKLMLEDVIFPWFLIKDISGKNQNRSGLQHVFCSPGKGINSNYFNNILPIINFLNQKEIKLLRANSFLQFPNPSYKKYDTPHFDLAKEKNYTVVLYYVLSSDGDTIFFNKDKKIIKRITPKQGNAVLFDGSYLHTAYQSKKNLRCVINFNIKGNYEDYLNSL